MDRPQLGSYNYISGYCKFVRTVRVSLSDDRREIEKERERERVKNPLSVGLQLAGPLAVSELGKTC